MKHMLIACALIAGAFLSGCKKEGNDPEIIVCPPPGSSPINGKWVMSTANVNMLQGAIVPEYTFTNEVFTYLDGMQHAPKTESGTFTMKWHGNNEPHYTVTLKPKGGAERTIEVNFVSDKQFSSGMLTWIRK